MAKIGGDLNNSFQKIWRFVFFLKVPHPCRCKTNKQFSLALCTPSATLASQPLFTSLMMNSSFKVAVLKQSINVIRRSLNTINVSKNKLYDGRMKSLV